MKDIKAICYPPGDDWRFSQHMLEPAAEAIDKRLWWRFYDRDNRTYGGGCAEEIMRDMEEWGK